MYIWNNIFFSLASDGRDHYKEFGGDEAAHAAAVSQGGREEGGEGGVNYFRGGGRGRGSGKVVKILLFLGWFQFFVGACVIILFSW